MSDTHKHEDATAGPTDDAAQDHTDIENLFLDLHSRF